MLTSCANLNLFLASIEYNCEVCDIGYNAHNKRPDAVSFAKYLPFFLQDNPDEICSKAGHAAYGQVNYNILF